MKIYYAPNGTLLGAERTFLTTNQFNLDTESAEEAASSGNIQDITSPYYFGGGYIKDFGALLGFGSTPSQCDIVTVVDTDSGQAFTTGLLDPGAISGITVGNFKFMGIVQLWKEHYGVDGFTYSTKLVDPRVMFNDVMVLFKGTGPQLPVAPFVDNGSGIRNIINVYNVFGNDYAADYNENGMAWNNIIFALENTSGYLNIYNKPFRLDFDTGWDAPAYLRINAQESTLTSLLDTAAAQLGIEYFVEIDYDTYVASTGVVSKINVRSIDRSSSATPGINITSFLNGHKASGVLIGYQKGRELRNGPTQVIVQGANYNYMYSTDDYIPCYGRAANGTLLTGGDNNTTYTTIADDDADRHDGFVMLDNLIVTPEIQELIDIGDLNFPTLTSQGKTRKMIGSVYPPMILDVTLSNSVVGYRPTENVMRAALFSRESWETLLYYEQQTVAEDLGIFGMYVKGQSTITSELRERNNQIRIEALDNITLERTEIQEAIIQLFYDTTRQVADEYYGKQFVVNLPLGRFNVGSTTGLGTTINFRYGYRVVDSAWWENASLTMKALGNRTLRETDGRHKAHLLYDDYTSELSPFTEIQYPTTRATIESGLYLNVDRLDKGNYIIDSSAIRVSCSVEQDYTNLGRAIVTLSQPLELVEARTGDIPASYVQFWKALGYNDLLIYGPSGVGVATDLYDKYGLAPIRLKRFDGFYIPLEDETRRFGPYVASSTVRAGGTSYIVDDSLTPWNHGGVTYMNTAGNGIANAAISDKIVIDNASFSIAGLPNYNMGDIIGDNNNITQMNFTFGPQGLISTYSLQTFSNPLMRYQKQTNTKLNKISVLSNRAYKETINLRDYLSSTNLDNSIFKIVKNYTRDMDPRSTNRSYGDKSRTIKNFYSRNNDFIVGNDRIT